MLDEYPEIIQALLLLLCGKTEKLHSDCLTILLALSFAPKGDFAIIMSQKPVFEVY